MNAVLIVAAVIAWLGLLLFLACLCAVGCAADVETRAEQAADDAWGTDPHLDPNTHIRETGCAQCTELVEFARELIDGRRREIAALEEAYALPARSVR